jgi:hypothetical protein
MSGGYSKTVPSKWNNRHNFAPALPILYNAYILGISWKNPYKSEV